jgi:hypothetical protein
MRDFMNSNGNIMNIWEHYFGNCQIVSMLKLQKHVVILIPILIFYYFDNNRATNCTRT